MTEVIRYPQHATFPRLAPWAEERLQKYMRAAGISSLLITSGRRQPGDQARIRFDLCERHGLDYARKLYGRAGNRVLDWYTAANPTLSLPPMTAAVIANGPTNVSRHCAPASESETFDVDPESVADQTAFLAALSYGQKVGEVDELIWPPKDPAIHVELITGAPDHPIVVGPTMSTVSKVVGPALFLFFVGWAVTR